MSLKHSIYSFLGRLFFPKFRNVDYLDGSIIKFIFWQKICRINSAVSWPVHFTSKIICPSKIKVADEKRFCPIGSAVGNYIDARNGIIIEGNVQVGPHVSIISKNHDATDYTKYTQDNPVIIHRNCWLATGAIILAGVELGEHTIVGAGAVVTHSFPEGNVLIAGNPAKVVKKLEPYRVKYER